MRSNGSFCLNLGETASRNEWRFLVCSKSRHKSIDFRCCIVYTVRNLVLRSSCCRAMFVTKDPISSIESPQDLLDSAYRELGYDQGILLDASFLPPKELEQTRVWLDNGDWLSMAASIGAEKILFIENEPIIVFRKAPDNCDQTLLEIYQRTWCMGRPQCLFIASPGMLSVYSLNQPPVQTAEDWGNIKVLDVVHKTTEVSEKLQAYHRERVESGQLFVDKDFGELEQRADRQLIMDLKSVRRSLLKVNPELDQKHIHALLGRSIFVRYLEDRGVLTPEYFQKIAEDTSHPKWTRDWLTIANQQDDLDLSPSSKHRRYARVLRNKDLTYAVFNQLSEHFNGDLFPRDQKEEDAITHEHLDLLRGFLLGNVDPEQPKLFLWAYDFEIIPIELISNIYEEFYQQSGDRDKGTHYTPSVLVEYVLTQVLTPERLATKPKILDLACGSAIFLVQAFKRIVRFHESQLGRRPSAKELREILRTQLTGIEINRDAVQVAAFSLYLALLHYQKPKSILAQIDQADGEKPLPFLIHDENLPVDSQNCQVLIEGNSFYLMEAERATIKRKLEGTLPFKVQGEFETLYGSSGTLPLEPNSFDVIVGNPPWGYLSNEAGTPELRAEQEHVLRWCRVFNWEPGDNEMSQAFMGRALSLLKPSGECGLLVSAGVVFKTGRKSIAFRQRWLSETCIKQVTNFAHVRDVFFADAIAPFCFVHYKSNSATSNHSFQYWSAKKTEVVDKLQSVVLALPDLHRVKQGEILNADYLWKVYWWGSHRDAKLITSLRIEKSMQQIAEEQKWPEPRVGFQGPRSSAKNKPRVWLADFKQLDVRQFHRYGPIDASKLTSPPNEVQTLGFREIYEGSRLLVKQGITQAGDANGRIDARLEDMSYSFTRSIYGINVGESEEWQRKILIAIVWSSLARYYFFMTGSSWGTWNHKILLSELMSLPIRFPQDERLRERIVSIVDELRSWNPLERDLLHIEEPTGAEIQQRCDLLEQRLDRAIFELYELTQAEQDLVLDMCEVGLEFFYRKGASNATRTVVPNTCYQGTIADLPADRKQEIGLQGYLYAFLHHWNRELDSVNGEFYWQIIGHPRIPMLAVVFNIIEKGKQHLGGSSPDASASWSDLLRRLDQALRYQVSSRIYLDGMARIVTDTEIIILKRDERRLWTRSMGREDAEATLLQAMIAQERQLTTRN